VSDDPGARGGSRPLPLSYAGYEFLLTTSLLFSVVTAVRWLRDPASGAYISALRPALAVLAGLTAVLLGRRVQVKVRGRRMRCPVTGCPRQTFREQVLGVQWKNPENLTGRQQAKLGWIATTNPRLYRAYLLKEGLRYVLKIKGEG
jgi:hypothetical protein